jgi:hypothetical protein
MEATWGEKKGNAPGSHPEKQVGGRLRTSAPHNLGLSKMRRKVE